MPLILSRYTDEVRTSVRLPLSKSVWNRVIMVEAYARDTISDVRCMTHDTQPDDVKKMYEVLKAIEAGQTTIDSGDAGTVTRFILTLMAMKSGHHVLTGSQRMRQRPIGPLVDALRRLGASIEYLDQHGFLPLSIEGSTLQGGEVSLNSTLSSQYASSLLLAAPMWPEGLILHLPQDMPSLPYIDMTLAVMRRYGAVAVRNGNVITVKSRPYQTAVMYQVPLDWSAASYWYEMAALSRDCDIFLPELVLDDIQGDAVVARMFEPLGVVTRSESHGIRLLKSSGSRDTESTTLRFDFSNCPDLFPAVFVSCVAKQRDAVFSGIRNLALKESNRVDALTTELSKIYTFINIVSDDEIRISNISKQLINSTQSDSYFETYNDHRIALSLAPLALCNDSIRIENYTVVEKSYPCYWSDIQEFFNLIYKN